MKIKNIKQIRELNYLKAYEIEYETKNGNKGYWELVSREGIERLQSEIYEGAIYTDGAMIVAMDESYSHVAMLREYRVSAGRHIYMFPAGLIDSGEDIETASKREFKEETGLELKVNYISPPRYVSVGIVNERVNVVYGHYSGNPSKEYQSEHEDAEIIMVDYSMAKHIIENEEISIRSAIILESIFELNDFIRETKSKINKI